MAYIGRDISNLSDRAVLDSITTSATATYNLLLNSVAFVPSSAESLTVSLNGVIQKPQSSYTVSGSTIIFDSALTSSDVIDFILAERAITLTTVGSGSVGTSQLVDGSVSNAKLENSSITLNGSAVSLGGSAEISAGSINLTAGANITLGDTLEITSSGTVKPVLEDGTLVSDELEILNGASQNKVKVVVLETDKYFAVYSENGSSVIKGVLITNSNGVLSKGTPVTVKSTANTNGDMLLRKLSSSLCVMVDRLSNQNLQVTAISISGSTITSGTPVSLYTSSNNNSFGLCRVDDTRFYVQRIEGQGHVPVPAKGRVGSISGTSITLGSEVDTSFTNAYGNSNIECAEISSTKVMIVWSRYFSYHPNAWFANISGTTITSYSSILELASANSSLLDSAILDSSNIAIAMHQGDTIVFQIINTTGSTPSVEQTVVYGSDKSERDRFGMGKSSTGITFGFRNHSATNNGNLTMSSLTYDASGPTLTKNEVVTISSDIFLSFASADVLDGTGIIVAQDTTNNNIGAFLFNPTLNDSVKRFIGVAGETFTNGNSGSVVHVGGIVSGLTGLTVGKNYYISFANGSLSTIVNSSEVGKAISATQLLITKTGVLN